MDVKELIKQIKDIEYLQIVEHKNGSGFLNVRCIISNHPKRFNVIGNLNPNTGSMLLYSEGKWVSNRTLGIINVQAAINWVKKDAQLLVR
ncbi:hypothetical protein LIT32_12390 [Bacillus sp. CMF21]|nr:hypothetical protein LIT32_12390 [Bacillus sp. CMF21]